ncbi:MAG: hypothetical protein E6G25_06095 [Actinobacteria bacterium]|nr:MAG: hypothetical protein E6G25_06095 [Actinomycetota bacterium]
MVMRSRNYAGALVAVALVTPLVARGAPDASGSDQYSAAITPTAVQPSQSALYEIDLKSHPRAPDSANEAEIDIPDGFSIDTSPIAITSCSATVWDATVDTAASRIVATSAPGAELCPGGTLSVSFSATGPAGEDVYLWTTRLTGASGPFTLAGSQPTTTVDGTAPETSLDAHPPDPNGRDASFSFSGNDAGGTGVAGFECDLDGGGFTACTSPQAYSGLADGSHTFQVRAHDAVGNIDPTPASFTWLIDTLRPVVTLSDQPPTLTNRTSATFSFSSSQSGSTFACSLDSGAFTSCTSPLVYSNLSDRAHTFAVQATALGNTGPATTYSWTVDTTAPETATFRVQAVDAAGNADATSASYAWTISEVGPATADHTPPGDVGHLKRSVAYGLLKLTWTSPPDGDFDHVTVLVSTSAKRAAGVVAYQGPASTYTERRFKNGLYYRYVVVSYDHSGNASHGIATVVPASALLRSPRDGATVRKPPTLVWTVVPKATFYIVQLYNRGRKVLSAWPAAAKLALAQKRSYAGRRFKLERGAYQWYVWPAFGPRSKFRYGQLIGQATFGFR